MNKLDNVKKVPHFSYTIGELPTSFKDSLTYQEQLTWLCNYLAATIEPSLNNNINAFNELYDYVNNALNDLIAYINTNLPDIAIEYLNENINNGNIFLSLGMDYISTDESLTFNIDSVPSEELLAELATLSTPQREV